MKNELKNLVCVLFVMMSRFKIAFLNDDIDETIYTVQPENFVARDSKQMVCKLNKFIYGLKQASR